MKKVVVVGLLVSLWSFNALAEAPSPSIKDEATAKADKKAVAKADAEDAEELIDGDSDLSKAIIEKLSPEQLAEVLKHKETMRARAAESDSGRWPRATGSSRWGSI